jgi:hypothetical protein
VICSLPYLCAVSGDIISPAESTKLEHMRDLLSPAASMTRKSEGEKYVTLSAVPYRLYVLLKATERNPRDSIFMSHLRASFRDCLKKRLGFILKKVNISLVAAALDPRFSHLEFISSSLRDMVWKQTVTWATEFLGMQFSSQNSDGSSRPSPAAEGGTGPPQPVIGRSHIKAIFKSLREYFETKPVEERLRGGPVDPLEEWDTYAGWYKSVRPFVNLLFAIPCTSAPSERTFSQSGNFEPKSRNRISEELLEVYTVTRSTVANSGLSPAAMLATITEFLSLPE